MPVFISDSQPTNEINTNIDGFVVAKMSMKKKRKKREKKEEGGGFRSGSRPGEGFPDSASCSAVSLTPRVLNRQCWKSRGPYINPAVSQRLGSLGIVEADLWITWSA